MVAHLTPTTQSGSGPWSAAALTRHALDDLRDTAQVAHLRQRHPDDILHSVAEQAALWHRRGARIDEHDVLRAVRAAVGADYQPHADLNHALQQDRIAQAITTMQQQIAGAAYRDGYLDAEREQREAIIEIVREVVAADLPDALRVLGVRTGRALP